MNLGERAEGGVLRACALTLIVLMEETDDAQAVGETLARLMRDHPSRAIVVRVRDCIERVLDARVLAQCWMPFGRREQICCEQIEITVSKGALADLAPVLPPLSAPDLPVVVWCRSPRLFEVPEFEALPAAKTIVDSDAWPDANAALRSIAGYRRPIADLAWTRLTRWRELVAQLFENRQYQGCLAQIRSARVICPGASAPARARYLAAWLQNGLEDAGSSARVELEPGNTTIIDLFAGEAASRHFSISHAATGSAEIRVDDLVNRTVFEPSTDYTLLREELAVTDPDPVFKRALARVAVSA